MKKHLLLYSFFCIILILFSSSHLNASIALGYNFSVNRTDEKWYTLPQIYDMGALSSKDIEKYHITVNGLWNGYIGDNLSSPFAFARLIHSVFYSIDYPSDEAFVEAQHQLGVKIPGTILTTQGHRSFQQVDFESFASRSYNNELCPWSEEADSYWMNALHPGFIEWCIKQGKKAIDAGADMIVLDEIQGNGLIPLFQWSSQYTGVPAPGFSNITIQSFRTYLSNTYSQDQLLTFFDIESIESYDLKSRIVSTMNMTFNERIENDSLIKDYNIFLETSNYEAKKYLIESLRSYASEIHRDIVITANSYTLGTNQQMGFWTKGLHFADLVDMFTFENTYTAFFNEPIPEFPRAKWLAWERLAYAATGSPAVILIDTSTLDTINNKIFPLFGFSNKLGILCAEAFSNRGSFVNYHFPFFNRENNWNACKDIYKFVTDHPELYDYSSKILSDIGIILFYSEGMRHHMNTYLGAAQALSESQIPYEVMFDGDDHYLSSTLLSPDIENFSLILVPSLVDVTDDQKHMVKEFVKNGGIALIFDGAEIGFNDISGEISYGDGLFYLFDNDYAKMYYETYQDSYREELTDCILSYIPNILHVNKEAKKLVVTPYIQEEQHRIILHLVNYDHIGIFDFIWPVSDITIKLSKPSFSFDTITLLQPTRNPFNLIYETTSDEIIFSVPGIKNYGVVVIE